MRAVPHGRGMFIHYLTQNRLPPPAQAAKMAKDAGFSWVAPKAQDGIGEFNVGLLDQYCEAFEGEGLEVWLWAWLYGADQLGRTQAKMEANRTADVCTRISPTGFIANPEVWFKRKGAAEWSNTYLTSVRTQVPDLSVGLCSYRFPSLHPEFPFRAWLGGSTGVDFHAPEVYWEKSHNPAQQVVRSYNELKALAELPFVIVGSAYTAGGWEPTVPELHAFHDQVLRLIAAGDVVAECWWEWHFAAVRRPQFWQAIATHTWPEIVPPAPPSPTTEQLVARLIVQARLRGWEV